MAMQFQSIYTINKPIDSIIKKNKNPSLSTVFRKIRRLEEASLIGDFVLIFYIYGYMYEKGFRFSESQCKRALANSSEYNSLLKSEKSSILFSLTTLKSGK